MDGSPLQPPEQPSPAGAQEFYQNGGDKWGWRFEYNGNVHFRSIFDFAEAYAKKERERADAAERRRDEFHLQLGKLYGAIGPMDEFDDVDTAVERVESLRTELREAKQRLQTFEDEHKRFLILSQTVVDLERELRELREAHWSESRRQ